MFGSAAGLESHARDRRVLGVPVAVVAVGFTSLLHGAESLLSDELRA